MSCATLQPRFGDACFLQYIRDALINPSGEVATSTFVTFVSFRDSILRALTPLRGSWGSTALFSWFCAIRHARTLARGWSFAMPLSQNPRTVLSLGLSPWAPGLRPPNPPFGAWLRRPLFLYTFSLATWSTRAPGGPGAFWSSPGLPGLLGRLGRPGLPPEPSGLLSPVTLCVHSPGSLFGGPWSRSGLLFASAFFVVLVMGCLSLLIFRDLVFGFAWLLLSGAPLGLPWEPWTLDPRTQCF